MRTAAVVGALLAVLSVPSAQAQDAGAAYEDVVKRMVSAVDKMTEILAAVKDSDSGGEARPLLKKAVEQLLTVRKEAEELKQPNQQEKDRIARAYHKKLAEAVTRFRQETSRVGTVPGGRDTLRELSALAERKKDGSEAKNK